MNQPAKHPILLVDDEPEILFSLQGLLRREFELFTANSGKEALEILAQHPIHVVMTDQRMPELTGAELVGRIKEEYPNAIRIVFTGYADIKAVIECINRGGLYRYITKPWDPDELVEVLHQAAAQYDLMAERKQLLRDLQDYVQSGQQLARQWRGDASKIGPQIEHIAANSTVILERLQRALAH
jgi:response regulator RpfG family c-di-GMP phosphodiesterase